MSTNTEKLKILGKSRLTVRDIRRLCDVGTDRAVMMAKEFKEWFKKEYPTAANLGIPTGLFVKYFGIQESRILKYAEIEKKNADAATSAK